MILHTPTELTGLCRFPVPAEGLYLTVRTFPKGSQQYGDGEACLLLRIAQPREGDLALEMIM